MKGIKGLCIIKWVDSSMPTDSSWQFVSGMKKPSSLVCLSVGWVDNETSDNIRLIPHIANIDGRKNEVCACGIMIIPKVAILERREIDYKSNTN